MESVDSQKVKYIYPRLPCLYDLGLFRVSGSGLANCFFVYAKALKYAVGNEGVKMIRPTWFQINLGPYIRREKDKRHYYYRFRSSEIGGTRKLFLLARNAIARKLNFKLNIKTLSGIEGFFEPVIDEQREISKQIIKSLPQAVLNRVPSSDSLKKSVAVHIRLGDYVQSMRTPFSWYNSAIENIIDKIPEVNEILVLSDGTDSELQFLLEGNFKIPIRRLETGDAFSDILSISKCCALVGSDSTFSAWGAFLGFVPSIFPKMHFGKISLECYNAIWSENAILEKEFIESVKKKMHNNL